MPSLASMAQERLRGLQAAKQAQAVREVMAAVKPYIPHQPTPKQAEFLQSTAREVLYGGAAGGGKSFALLMAALQYVNVPGYSALILRRTMKQAKKSKAVLDVAHDWLRGTDARWDTAASTFRFPSGATLEFGYLDSENDKYNYQSPAYSFVGWDELTQFTLTQYTYLFSRLRRTAGSEVPSRMRATSNPGGVGHEWVLQRFFVDGANHGRVFIPARLEDNHHLDTADYEESLAELDPVTRRQLRHGDWTVRASGNFFKRERFILVDEPPPLLGARIIRFWDLAATEDAPGKDPDWTVGVKMAELRDGGFFVMHVRRFRKNPGETENAMRAQALEDGVEVEQVVEQEGGSSGKFVAHHFASVVFKGLTSRFRRATGDKVQRAKPFAAAVENGLVQVLRAPWTTDYLDELVPFPSAGIHDDQVDGSSGAFAEMHQGGEEQLPKKPHRAKPGGLAGLEM